jgi:hypothetical protein
VRGLLAVAAGQLEEAHCTSAAAAGSSSSAGAAGLADGPGPAVAAGQARWRFVEGPARAADGHADGADDGAAGRERCAMRPCSIGATVTVADRRWAGE